MYFPLAPDPNALRHPSQLYEAFFEGIFLFIVLYLIVRRLRLPKGGMFPAYIFGYGFVRFFIEFFREPDRQLGFVLFGKFSRGQELCAAMMVIAIGFYAWLAKRKPAEAAPAPRDPAQPVKS